MADGASRDRHADSLEIVERALPRVLGESLTASAELARAADVLGRVANAIPDADGRPLYAGHAELPWPQSPHSRLWHAITLCGSTAVTDTSRR